MGAGRAGRGRQAQDAPPTCGQLLQRYRMLAGLTQEELAERAGYSGNYIGKLEQDQRELPAAAADRLAEVLGLAGRVDLLLPDLAPPDWPDPAEGGAPAGVQPEQQRRLLVSSVGRLLHALAGPAGTLLVLDDLHWAGPDAVDLLAALLAAAGSPTLPVIRAYRGSET